MAEEAHDDGDDDTDQADDSAAVPARRTLAHLDTKAYDPWGDPPPVDPRLPRLPEREERDEMLENMERVDHDVFDALSAKRAAFKKCYTDTHPPSQSRLEVRARLRVVSDGNETTRIDPLSIVGSDGEELKSEVEACLRDVLSRVELPPAEQATLYTEQYLVLTSADSQDRDAQDRSPIGAR
ncbi:MAG: hypothetical protein JWO36_4460 [Myxococcales bacterium]|nr:hypothetical protein [Myxococcales bacterium]